MRLILILRLLIAGGVAFAIASRGPVLTVRAGYPSSTCVMLPNSTR